MWGGQSCRQARLAAGLSSNNNPSRSNDRLAARTGRPLTFSPGTPPSVGAIRTARRIASETASAAATPSASCDADSVAQRQADHQIAVRHRVHRANRPRHARICATCASRVASTLSSFALVATTTSVVFAARKSAGDHRPS